MSVGLYRVTYEKNDEPYEVIMPIVDWVYKKATEKKDSEWISSIREEYLDFAKRFFPGVDLNPSGVKEFSFERLRKAKMSDTFKAVMHRKLTP